ncbi:MAG TPA: hypothetical protein VHC46_06140 [Thermodesulfobacteriota bacterium]|nr:hypothetical protein [Thermodesulfobacteriota bacterium]
MKIFSLSLLLAALSVPAFAQNQSEYPIADIKDGFMLIGQKPYRMVSECPTFQVGDQVTFSEDPITCEMVTAIDTLSLAECNLICIDNLGAPEPN